MRTIFTLAALGLALCACTDQGGVSSTTPVSGITSSNGGGQRATGAIPNFAVGPNGGAVTTGVPNGRGNAY